MIAPRCPPAPQCGWSLPVNAYRHGNDARITYEYDPETFRVIRIRTRRPHPQPQQRRVQGLHYLRLPNIDHVS